MKWLEKGIKVAVTFQGVEVSATSVLPALLEVTGIVYTLGIKFLLFYPLSVETVYKNCNYFARMFIHKLTCKEENSDWDIANQKMWLLSLSWVKAYPYFCIGQNKVTKLKSQDYTCIFYVNLHFFILPSSLTSPHFVSLLFSWTMGNC